MKNKLFFFESFEFFDLPQSFTETGTWLTPAAASGIFTYNAGGAVRTVNLYSLAAAANPLAAGRRPPVSHQRRSDAGENLFADQPTHQRRRHAGQPHRHAITITTAITSPGTRRPSTIASSKPRASTTTSTKRHHINFVWNYQINDRTPDGLNRYARDSARHGNATGLARSRRPVRHQLDGKHRRALGDHVQHHQRIDGRHPRRRQRAGRRASARRLRHLERKSGQLWRRT